MLIPFKSCIAIETNAKPIVNANDLYVHLLSVCHRKQKAFVTL